MSNGSLSGKGFGSGGSSGGGGTFADASLLREQFPTLEASDFFRDPIDIDFVESTIENSVDLTMRNIERSADLAAGTAETLGGINVGNFQSALEAIAPAAVELQAARDAAIASLLAGEVPAEVSESIARQRAEVSALSGVGATSGFALNRTFRDFGLSALDAIQSGIGFATQAIGQESEIALGLTPRSEGVFSALLGEFQRAGVPSAGEVFRLSAEAERSNQIAAMETAAQNLALDINAFELIYGAQAADDLRRASRTNALIGGGATLLGAAIGAGAFDDIFGGGEGSGTPSLTLGQNLSDPTGLTFNEQGFVTGAELSLGSSNRQTFGQFDPSLNYGPASGVGAGAEQFALTAGIYDPFVALEEYSYEVGLSLSGNPEEGGN